MNDLTSNLKTVTFTLDGEQVTTDIGQTIWQAAAKLAERISRISAIRRAEVIVRMATAGPVW